MIEADMPADARRRLLGAQPLLLLLGFAVLIAISGASIWLAARSDRDAEAVARTLGMQNRLSQLLLHLRRAESRQRGYLITGQPAYRDEYRRSAANAVPAMEEVKSVIADNPQQQAAFARIEPMIRKKLDEMQRIVALHDERQTEAAREAERSGEPAAMMESIRVAVARMYQDGRLQLEQQRAESLRTSRYLLAASLIGSAVILLIGAVSVYLVQRANRQRDEVSRALEAANENLEATIAERTADLREANDEIQRFAYIVSHDLRSPLVNIMGFTTELESLKKTAFGELAALRAKDSQGAEKDVELSEEFDESVGFIKNSIAKMDRLINSVLKLSREGRRQFKPEYISMDDLMRTILETVAHQAAANGIEVSVGPLPALKSDRMALEQIFSNLVDNALKYMQPGRPGLVRISGRSTQHQVIYEVEDNGRGIAPEDQQRIFDLFRRAGRQDKPGEGIGLAHARAMVRRLGGYMSLRSELGRGSTFIVTLPRRMAGEERSAA